MSKSQYIDVLVNVYDAENLEKLMSQAIAEIIINRIDKLPDDIKGGAYEEIMRTLEK